LQLKKFQSKQQQQCPVSAAGSSPLNGSEPGAVTNSTGNPAEANHLDNSSSCNESLCQEVTFQMSRESSPAPSSIGQGSELAMGQTLGMGTLEQFRCHSVPKNFNNAVAENVNNQKIFLPNKGKPRISFVES
jgi:hypothetical protein